MSRVKSGQEALLSWCKKCTEGYKDVSVTNFHTSWRDGLAFCALIHHFHPEAIDFSKLKKEDIEENNRLAFTTAEKLGIPALLDVEDMVALVKPEPFSIMTYLSQYYRQFEQTEGGVAGASSSAPHSQHRAPESTTAKIPVTPPQQLHEPRRPENPRTNSQPIKKCFKCGSNLSGEVVDAGNDKMFHARCFTCAGCKTLLGDRFVNVGGNIYCSSCGNSASMRALADKNKNERPTTHELPQEETSRKENEERERKEKLEREKREREEKEREEQLKQERLQKQTRETSTVTGEADPQSQTAHPAGITCTPLQQKPSGTISSTRNTTTLQNPNPPTQGTIPLWKQRAMEAKERNLQKEREEQELRRKKIEACTQNKSITESAPQKPLPTPPEKPLPTPLQNPLPAPLQDSLPGREERREPEIHHKGKEETERTQSEGGKEREAQKDMEAKPTPEIEQPEELAHQEQNRRNEETSNKQARKREKLAKRERQQKEKQEREARELERQAREKKEREAREQQEREEMEKKAREERNNQERAEQARREQEILRQQEQVERDLLKKKEEERLQLEEKEKLEREASQRESLRMQEERENERLAKEARERKDREVKERELYEKAERERIQNEQKEREAQALRDHEEKILREKAEIERRQEREELERNAAQVLEAKSKAHVEPNTREANEESISPVGIEEKYGRDIAQSRSTTTTVPLQPSAMPSTSPLIITSTSVGAEEVPSKPEKPLSSNTSAQCQTSIVHTTSPSPDPSSTSATIHEKTAFSGFLMCHCGSVWKLWWFVLQDTQLAFYPDSTCTSQEGAIPLSNISAVDITLKKEFQFQITERNNTLHALQAGSQPEMEQWISLIKQKCGLQQLEARDKTFVMGKGERKHTVVVKKGLYERREGWLEELNEGLFSSSWKRKWAVMGGGFLYLYASKAETGQRVTFPLYHCKIEMHMAEKFEGRAFRLTSEHPDNKSSRTIILRASEELEMHHWLNALTVQRLDIDSLIDGISFYL
ncbi:protein-methionine sulfoxide oxidase mical2b [Pelomyxa schiedti]|nr:protein-methionine sulfoxide oxidase mical2b [Pelomyxa schiedti]